MISFLSRNENKYFQIIPRCTCSFASDRFIIQKKRKKELNNNEWNILLEAPQRPTSVHVRPSYNIILIFRCSSKLSVLNRFSFHFFFGGFVARLHLNLLTRLYGLIEKTSELNCCNCYLSK